MRPSRKRPSTTTAKLGGRPRSRLPVELLEKLGPPPSDQPLQLARWTTKLVAETFWLKLQGKVAEDLAASVRAFAGSITRSQPIDIASELERLLRAEAGEIAADEHGPRPEKVGGAAH